jgi:hypothetical protein
MDFTFSKSVKGDPFIDGGELLRAGRRWRARDDLREEHDGCEQTIYRKGVLHPVSEDGPRKLSNARPTTKPAAALTSARRAERRLARETGGIFVHEENDLAPPTLPPGDYALELSVYDELEKRPQSATQWVDFTLVK